MIIKPSIIPRNLLRGIVPTATLWDGNIGFAYLDDGGAFTDDTVDANSAAANDVPLMPAVPVLNDAFYFGENFSTSGIWNTLKINLGTAGVGGTIAWEYYNGATWAALTVVDATNGFTTAGAAQYVTFTSPTNWAAVAVNAQTRFWIRARVLTAFAPIPLATQIWVGRYPINLSNTTDGDVTTFAGVGVVQNASATEVGIYTFNLGSVKTVAISVRAGIWASASSISIQLADFTDGVNHPTVGNTNIISTTVSGELIYHSLTGIITTQFFNIRCVNGAANTIFVKLYEVKAYELGT